MTNLISNTTHAGLSAETLNRCPAATGFEAHVSELEAQSQAIVAGCLEPGCPLGVRTSSTKVAAMEAQAEVATTFCLNPICPFGMHMQGKTPEKLTIV